MDKTFVLIECADYEPSNVRLVTTRADHAHLTAGRWLARSLHPGGAWMHVYVEVQVWVGDQAVDSFKFSPATTLSSFTDTEQRGDANGEYVAACATLSWEQRLALHELAAALGTATATENFDEDTVMAMNLAFMNHGVNGMLELLK